MAHSSTSTHDAGERVHRAGLFDIRTFIGGLLGLYGVILVLAGLFATDDAQLAKTDDFNINLVAGALMIGASIFFIGWARLRPVVVTEHRDSDDSDTPDGTRPSGAPDR